MARCFDDSASPPRMDAQMDAQIMAAPVWRCPRDGASRVGTDSVSGVEVGNCVLSLLLFSAARTSEMRERASRMAETSVLVLCRCKHE